MSKHHSYQIESWFSEDWVSGVFDLLYPGSRYVWKGSYFDAKCYNKGATITVILTTCGFIYGGFSDKSWTSVNKYCDSNKIFLFSLKSTTKKLV